MNDTVFAICIAYESGIYHGLNNDELPNPYPYGHDEHRAYNYGYNTGKQKATDTLKQREENGDANKATD